VKSELPVFSAETRSSQVPTSAVRLPLLFDGTLPCLWVIYSSHPTPSPLLQMHPLAQPALDIHHAALSSLPPTTPLGPAFLASPGGATAFHLVLHYPQRWLTTPCWIGLALMMTLMMMTLTIRWGLRA